MIEICQKAMKAGFYDGDKFTVEIGPFAPCSITQMLFPEILDMALEHLKRKTSYSLVEYDQVIEKTPKNRDKKIIPLPIFQSRKEQFS